MKNQGMTEAKLFILTLIITMICAGCSGKSTSESFLRQDVDLSFVTRIAVLPLENNTDEKFADDRVRNVTITQVLALGLFDVIDKGLVDSVLNDEAIDKNTPIDPQSLKRLGKRLNAQAFLLGSVDQSGESRKGTMAFPETSITLRLVDANTSTILWQASGHRSGDSTMGRLFGLSPDDAFQVTTKLTRELLSTLPVK